MYSIQSSTDLNRLIANKAVNIASQYNIHIGEIFSTNIKNDVVVRARYQLIKWLSETLYQRIIGRWIHIDQVKGPGFRPISSVMIGRLLGIDHTTVLNTRKKYASNRDTRPEEGIIPPAPQTDSGTGVHK